MLLSGTGVVIMRLEQISLFREVAEQKSFTLAAKRLYVSQPSVSQQIATLERELGFRLFERNSKKVVLTPAGDFFYEAVACELEGLREAIAQARRISEGATRVSDGALPVGQPVGRKDHPP
jgi:LysR family hydrogen peroxide-inducible transcriptional activator